MQRAEGKASEDDEYKLYVKNLDTGEDVAVSETLRGFATFTVAEAKDVHASDLLSSKGDGDSEGEGFGSEDDE
jgi:hypothetical protein